MRTAIWVLLISVFASEVRLPAASFYVAPGASGDGALGNPGSLTNALAHSGWAAAIAGGDTVFLRGTNLANLATGGTYYFGTGMITMAFSGSAGNMVEWRNYPGECVVFDVYLHFGNKDFHRFLNDSLFGFIVEDRHKDDRDTAVSHFDGTTGTHNEYVNLVVHDTMGVWSGTAGGSLIYGCVTWFTGVSYRDHVVYATGVSGSSNVLNCIFGWNAGTVIEIGCPGGRYDSNFIYQTSETFGVITGQRSMALTVSNQTSRGNRIWERFTNTEGIRSQGGGYKIIADNRVSAPSPYVFGSLSDSVFTVTNNLGYANQSGTFYQIYRTSNPGTWTLNNNSYYDTNGVNHFNETNSSVLTFGPWQSLAGVDANSTASSSINPPDSVTVYGNLYQSKRAHVWVENYSAANNVVVTNLAIAMSIGDVAQIYNAQDLFRGPIKQETVQAEFNGSITVPMTNLSVATILSFTNIGTPTAPNESNTYSHQPFSTSPYHGAFVVIGEASGTKASGMTLRGAVLR